MASTDLSRRSRSPTGDESSIAPRNRAKEARVNVQTDVILPTRELAMQQIVTGAKTYDFRKYGLKRSVKRIWFYRTAPHSSLDYVCEILPARTRTPTVSHPNMKNPAPDSPPLEEDGSIGNHEFNHHGFELEGYDYAYKILSVHKLDESIPLQELKDRYGFKSAPKGMTYVPQSLLDRVQWRSQSKLR